MADPSELRNLIAKSNEALSLVKEKAEREAREMEEKYRDNPRAVFVRWREPIFIGGAW